MSLILGRPSSPSFPDCCQVCKCETPVSVLPRERFPVQEEQSRITICLLCSLREARLTWDKKEETQNCGADKQHFTNLINILLSSTISIKIQMCQRTPEKLQAFLGREVRSVPARSEPSPQQGNRVACLARCSLRFGLPPLKQLGPTPGRLAGRVAETKARDTCFYGNTAKPVQVSGPFAQVLAVGQDAFHVADFTADSTAWNSLEVHAVSQGLRSKFL